VQARAMEQSAAPYSFADFHVHVGERIGGYQLRDGFAELAKVPGLMAIGAFVTEESGDPLGTKLQRMRQDSIALIQREASALQIFWHLTPVQTGFEEVLPLLSQDTDLKFYTTYKNVGLYRSYEEIERWMTFLKDRKVRMLVHCEDDGIIAEYAEKHPFRHPHDHSLRRPELAENIAVERILDLAVKHAYPVHIVHVSSPQSALLIREAKQTNPLVTCETAPHYLLYNESRLTGENAHRWICSPPFRSDKSRGELVELMQDGVFDLIASDHCPFSNDDKDRYKDTPEKVPCGIPGVGTLYGSMFEHFVKTGKISQEQLTRMSLTTPVQLMGSN